MNLLKRAFKDNKDIIVFLVLMVLFRSSFADVNRVPTGSMKPTIVEGDRIVVNKLAYDVQLPLLNTKLFKLADPVRGDIVVFNSKAADNRLVKRLIGVPGDRVELVNNQLFINETPLDYNFSAPLQVDPKFIDVEENLVGIVHGVRLSTQPSRLSSFAPVIVPEGFYLALGDNRDNSSDSRVIGFVPRSEIIGRSRHVMMSLNPDQHYLPRWSRFFKRL